MKQFTYTAVKENMYHKNALRTDSYHQLISLQFIFIFWFICRFSVSCVFIYFKFLTEGESEDVLPPTTQRTVVFQCPRTGEFRCLPPPMWGTKPFQGQLDIFSTKPSINRVPPKKSPKNGTSLEGIKSVNGARCCTTNSLTISTGISNNP